MELNAKLNREKEENKNKKNNKESEAKNKILILGILILIVSGLFLSIGLNANNMDYALSQRIPKLLAIILTGVCISISTTIFQTISGNKIAGIKHCIKNIGILTSILNSFFTYEFKILFIFKPFEKSIFSTFLLFIVSIETIVSKYNFEIIFIDIKNVNTVLTIKMIKLYIPSKLL